MEQHWSLLFPFIWHLYNYRQLLNIPYLVYSGFPSLITSYPVSYTNIYCVILRHPKLTGKIWFYSESINHDNCFFTNNACQWEGRRGTEKVYLNFCSCLQCVWRSYNCLLLKGCEFDFTYCVEALRNETFRERKHWNLNQSEGK